ncbi:MAG: hypothetical protein PHD76_11885 [Methylacidiphilales bacterium]|nr:hypothetical protein [Candidatus Methylacidiphilales bacterium]
MKRLYYYTFYCLYKFAAKSCTEGWKQWYGVALITLIELWLLGIVDLWCEIWTGHSYFFSLGRPALLIIAAVIYALNYYPTIAHARWRLYANEFDNLDQGQRVRWVIAIITGIACTIALLFYSFHVFGEKMSALRAAAH